MALFLMIPTIIISHMTMILRRKTVLLRLWKYFYQRWSLYVTKFNDKLFRTNFLPSQKSHIINFHLLSGVLIKK